MSARHGILRRPPRQEFLDHTLLIVPKYMKILYIHESTKLAQLTVFTATSIVAAELLGIPVMHFLAGNA
jgi:hypothetical protein